MTALKVLFFDIETSPLTAHIWRPTDQYVPMERLIEDSYMINWGSKWADSDILRYGLVTPEEARNRDDSRIVPELANQVRKADYVVGHNIDGFDWPRLNARVVALDLEPLGPVSTIDTFKLAKKNLQIAYLKLDYLGEYLGLGRKLKTDMELWLRCMKGDRAALQEMKLYNQQDVLLLEKVFERLKPHVRNFPKLHTANHQGERMCPFCGAGFEFMKARGYRETNGSTFVKYRCDKCGKYSRARTAERTKKLGVHPL